MGFIIVNTAPGSPQPDVELVDIGITVPGGGSFDLITEQPNDIAMSGEAGVGSLWTAITAGTIQVLDPLDDVTPLGTSDAIFVVQVHNDPHFRINGGTLNQLDDVDTTGANPGDVLQLIGSPTVYTPVAPSDLAGSMNLTDLGDIDSSLLGSPLDYGTDSYILVGDGAGNATLTPITGPGSGSPEGSGPFCEVIEDTVGAMLNRSTHSDITVVYIDGAGTCDGQLNFSVDDVFLHNTGPETFGPGTLTFTDGSTLIIAGPGAGSPGTSSGITIEQDATATLETPTGGFTNDNDLINKAYVDSLAAGLDPKESVRAATQPGDTAGTYVAASPCGPGDTITGFPGILDTVQLNTNDRVLVKDRIDATQNGIYVVSSIVGSPIGSPIGSVTLTRAEDQNGDPGAEVSSGNFTHVEQGSQNINTKWVTTGDGVLALCTDDINWVLFSGPDTIIADVGLTRVANTISLDLGDLSTGVPVLTDTIGFHDADGTAQGVAGSQTYSTTFDDLFSEFNVAYNITGQGIIVRTGGSPDSYAAREIEVDGLGNLDGLSVVNGDGIAGNPTLGLNIQNLPGVLVGSPGGVIDTADEIAVYDTSHDRNVSYTVGQIATALASTNSFETWIGSGNTAGSSPAAIVADSATDTVTLIGGTGITLDFSTAGDSVEWALDFDAIPSTGSPIGFVGGNTEIIINNGGTVETVTLNELLGNLISGGNGINITTAGSPEQLSVELDICGVTPSSPDDLDAADTLAVCDGSDTVSMTGQQIADGVVNILNLADIQVELINGQPITTYVDGTRGGSPGGKRLSTDMVTYGWEENTVGNNDWVRIGGAVDAISGHVMPLDATIVGIVAHTSDDNGNSKGIRLYIDGTPHTTDPLFSFTAVSGENAYNSFVSMNLDIDVDQGEKIRLRGAAAGGTIQDTVITLYIRWRS